MEQGYLYLLPEEHLYFLSGVYPFFFLGERENKASEDHSIVHLEPVCFC